MDRSHRLEIKTHTPPSSIKSLRFRRSGREGHDNDSGSIIGTSTPLVSRAPGPLSAATMQLSPEDEYAFVVVDTDARTTLAIDADTETDPSVSEFDARHAAAMTTERVAPVCPFCSYVAVYTLIGMIQDIEDMDAPSSIVHNTLKSRKIYPTTTEYIAQHRYNNQQTMLFLLRVHFC